MSQYFLKPYELCGGDINVKVQLSNYATKTDFKNATGVDIDEWDLEKKISNAGKKKSGLVKKLDYNAKITEIEGKIPSITSLATTS